MDMESAAVTVKTATGAYTAAGAIGTFVVLSLSVIAAWIRFGPKWKEIAVTADQRFRDDLLQRVVKLEKTLERERARHEAERALDRHKFNNLTQCFDAVMLMLEAAPEKAAEIVERIKAMRATQIKAEALEKAAIHAAEIVAKEPVE